ncbi:MAG: hypothetical protein JO051_10785, partial [Acidobacteriaceae bacterium]|nr:hypothetical protein [Acidobacteriaceae bacterium]
MPTHTRVAFRGALIVWALGTAFAVVEISSYTAKLMTADSLGMMADFCKMTLRIVLGAATIHQL